MIRSRGLAAGAGHRAAAAAAAASAAGTLSLLSVFSQPQNNPDNQADQCQTDYDCSQVLHHSTEHLITFLLWNRWFGIHIFLVEKNG